MRKAIFGAIITLALPLAVFAAPAPAPVDCTLSASKTDIKRGESITLTWTTANTTYRLLGGIGLVPTSGSKVVKPAAGPMSYSLFVVGKTGVKECAVNIRVR